MMNLMSSKPVMTWLSVALLLGCLTVLDCSQPLEYFPCALDRCSITRQQFCNEKEERCNYCQREMHLCGTSEMVNMRNTCLIYCYRDLMDKNLREQFQRQIQDINHTWTQKEEALQQEKEDLLATIVKLRDDLAHKQNEVIVLGVGLGIVSGVVVILIIIAVKKGYFNGCGESGKDDLISPTEEVALTVVTTSKQDVDAKLSAVAGDEAEEEASSGRGSAEISPAESTEMLKNQEKLPLLQAGLDQEGSPPREASGGAGPPRAGIDPPTPGPLETPVKGGRNRPNNGQAFPDLPRGDNGSEDVSLASNRAPSPASTASPAQAARAILTPRCCICQQDVVCQTCTRAQSLSDQSASVLPAPAQPNNTNCSLAEGVYNKINSVTDTAPHSSAFTPS